MTSVLRWTKLRSRPPNVVVEWRTLLLCVREVSGSNLDPETINVATEIFRGFTQSLQVDPGIVAYLQIKPRTLPSKSFHFIIRLSPYRLLLYSVVK
jgi:hypothetical protein